MKRKIIEVEQQKPADHRNHLRGIRKTYPCEACFTCGLPEVKTPPREPTNRFQGNSGASFVRCDIKRALT